MGDYMPHQSLLREPPYHVEISATVLCSYEASEDRRVQIRKTADAK